MDWRSAESEYTDDTIGASTLPVLFEESAGRHTDRVAHRYKGGVYDRSLTPDPIESAPDGTFSDLTYGQLRRLVRRLAAGFRELGVDTGDRVAIFSSTRMEWAQADLAILAAGGVVTTIYENASERLVRYILEDSGAVGVVVENAKTRETVEAAATDLDLSFVASIDESQGLTLGDVYETGTDAWDREDYDGWIAGVESNDLASLIYTSGTTGQPKGVQLTHGNIRANLNQIRKRYGPRPDKPRELPRIDETSKSVSFLPLAHVFERTAGHFTMLAAGAAIAYAESPDTLREDFQAVRPTVATSVPRVYEKIYQAIAEQASSLTVKERIFHWAVDVGQAYHHADDPGAGLRAKQSIADRLVFSQVKEALGGRIEMLISGGSSLSPELCALYHGMGLPIYEGYGLTETSPVATCNPVERPEIGTIGPPLVDMEVRLDREVVPEDAFDDREGDVGELLLRGPNVSSGYWERPEQTAQAFSDEGWFRTGDIVRQRPDGYLVFLERRKEVIVLSTGKNLAPGPIEDGFAASRVVEQCMVVGEGEKFVGALIVPNLEVIREWAETAGHTLSEDPSEVCADPRVRDRVWEEVDRVNDEFEDYETIKEFRLIPEEFTEERDLLTPTMKKKRRNILEAYADAMAEMYAED